jgi:hypothetical protein
MATPPLNAALDRYEEECPLRRFARAIVTVFGVACAAISVLPALSGAEAQQSAKMYRVGLLTAGSSEQVRQSLRDLGYIEGRNVILEVRLTEGKVEQVNDLALQLARLADQALAMLAAWPLTGAFGRP